MHLCIAHFSTPHHTTPSQSDVSYEYFGNAFTALAETSFGPREEVCLSYGQRSNDQLLQFYGFVENENPYEQYVPPPGREGWRAGWNLLSLLHVKLKFYVTYFHAPHTYRRPSPANLNFSHARVRCTL